MNFWFLLLLSWVLTWPGAVFAQIAVNFQPQAAVAGSRILLADIALIQPKGEEAEAIGQLQVGASPPMGKVKEFSTPAIISSLRNRPEVADVDWQGSETIEVRRLSRKVGANEMQQIIVAYLKENSSRLPKTEIRFTATHPPEELTLPEGKLSWQVIPSRPGIMGSTSFSILFSVGGKTVGNCTVRGKLEAMAEVVTSAANLHKGEILTEAHLTLQKQDIGGLDAPFTSLEQLVGQQMARSVPLGKAIERNQVSAPTVIKDGDMVKMVARKEGMQLSTNGLARGEGRLGEMIQVKNISSSKMVQCRVDGPGMVSVEF